jgi:hypothetical protein
MLGKARYVLAFLDVPLHQNFAHLVGAIGRKAEELTPPFGPVILVAHPALRLKKTNSSKDNKATKPFDALRSISI